MTFSVRVANDTDSVRDVIAIYPSVCIWILQGLKAPFCVPMDELLHAKDDLLSEPAQSLSSLTEQVVRQSLQLLW